MKKIYTSVTFITITALFISFSPTTATYAQDTPSAAAENEQEFTIGIQVRPRFEFRHGFKRPLIDTIKAAAFVEQRTRLWVDYRTSKIHLHVNLQDVRMWGSTNQIYKTDGSLFNAYEAYAEYFFNKKWAIKVGRQALDYDNARFFGNLDWAQQGRSHDALIVKYETPKNFKLHFGGGMNQFQNEPSYLSYQKYNNSNNKWMAYAWLHKKWDNFKFSALVQNDAREKADSNLASRQTFALIPSWDISKKFNLAGEFYFQSGKNASDQNVSAYFANVQVTFKTDLTPIMLGGEIASGTAWNADNNTDNSWNPLYGTNHKFYGFMDYFYVGNGHGQAAGRAGGLIDLYVKTKFKLTENKKHFLQAHLHQFLSPVEVVDLNSATNQTVSTNLGTEIDLVYQWKAYKGVDAIVGYSHMFATESMNQIKGIPGANAPNNFWVWAQINFKMDVFKRKG